MKFKILILSLITLIFSACKVKNDKDIVGTYSSKKDYLVKAGDIVVANGTSDSLILLDTNGNFKTTLYDVDNQSESISGIAFKSDTKEIIFTVTGSNRVGAVSMLDGTYRNFIINSNLTSPLRGVAQLKDGSILVSHAGIVQKFDTYGNRITVGGWPKTLLATPQQIEALPNGGFVLCSDTTDLVRTYNAAGTQIGTSAASGIAGTTDAFGCMPLANGKIVGAWNGTTDTLTIWNSDFTGKVDFYSDIGTLQNPRWIAQRANGNLLIADGTNQFIVEVTTAGVLVNTLGGAFLNNPVSVFVVPSY